MRHLKLIWLVDLRVVAILLRILWDWPRADCGGLKNYRREFSSIFTKSSADSMGDSILSTVRKAARLAVYEEIIMRVKNHHIPATIRVEIALKNYNGQTLQVRQIKWLNKLFFYLSATFCNWSLLLHLSYMLYVWLKWPGTLAFDF